MRDWTLYILECSDGSWYTGITQDLELRLLRHSEGNGAKYTRSRRPVKPLFTVSGFDHHQAAVLEIQVKKLNRDGKTQFMNMRGVLWKYYNPESRKLVIQEVACGSGS